MNNRISIIICLLLGVLLTACTESAGDVEGQDSGSRNSYISITINADNGSKSRAEGDLTSPNGGNANLVNGSEYEDELINAYLLIFEGATADAATFCGGFRIFNMKEEGGTVNVHISNRYSVKDLTLYNFKPETGKTYWGLILANIHYSDDCTVLPSSLTYKDYDGNTVTSSNVSYGTFKANAYFFLSNMNGYGASALTPSPKSYQSHHLRNSAGYIVMTNAMMFDKKGTEAFWKEDGTDKYATPIELIDITDKIKEVPYGDETEPDDGDWATFHIERVAAKVQVTVDEKLDLTEEGDETPTYGGTFKVNGADVPYVIENWCLVNVAPETKLFRDWGQEWPSFKSSKFTEASKYRFISSSEHYEEGSTKYYRGYFTRSSRYADNDDAYNTDLKKGNNWSSGNFHYQAWKQFGQVDYCHENTMQVEEMMVKNATHVLVKVKFNNGSTFIDGVTNKTYTDGYAYYILKIPHFGDEYTPWHQGEADVLPLIPSTESPSESDNIDRCFPASGKSGTSRDDNYLGRWGVVRNTWYQLNIKGIAALGMNVSPLEDPTIITNDPTPLDYYENLMYTTVKVNDWNVRDQSVVLQ